MLRKLHFYSQPFDFTIRRAIATIYEVRLFVLYKFIFLAFQPKANEKLTP